MGSRKSDKNNQTIATNRKARHDYAIDETYEAGLVLMGSEVKSLREGKVTAGDGYVAEFGGELFLVNVHIAEYPFASVEQHDPMRRRKLLLSRDEIERISEKIGEKGFTGVPLRFYFKDGRVKVEIGLGKGKKHYDKRQDLKERDAKREIDRAMR